MPDRRRVGQQADDQLCGRCQQAEHYMMVRNERLCKDCLCKYVQTKVVKRMESFRVRHSEPDKERKLLLALSLGPSSTALLHILDQHLHGQANKTGRTGFSLCVMHVKEVSSPISDNSSLFEGIERRYPDHEYLERDLSAEGFVDELSTLRANQAPAGELNPNSEQGPTTSQFWQFLDSLKSASARADAINIVKRRLITKVARERECEAVLWAHNTTTLAQKVLAETAKGRGFSLPWVVKDGDTPHGLPFYYPLRELLHSEVASYVSLIEPPIRVPLHSHNPKAIVSAKSTTIDELMEQYFESIESDYPSTVSNVVRTTAKLKQVSLADVVQRCELCDIPFEGRAPDRSRLCFGCVRTLSQ